MSNETNYEYQPAQDHYEVAKQAMGMLRFYSDYYGSAEPYQEKLKEITDMLRSKGANMKRIGNFRGWIFLRAFADALQFENGKPANYVSQFE